MQFIFSKEAVGHDAADMLIRGILEDAADVDRALKAHDKRLDGHLGDHVRDDGFSGKADERLSLHTHGKMLAKRIVLQGLGPATGFDLERLRRAAGAAYRLGASAKASRLAVSLPWALAGDSLQEALTAMLEGFLLAGYRFTRYKAPKKDEKRPETIIVSVHDATRPNVIEAALRLATAGAEAAAFARDLVNTPSLDMTPKTIVAEAEKVAKASSGRVKLRTFDRAALEKMGCGGILGVAQGSMHEPYMIHLKYSPKGRANPTSPRLRGARKRVVLVGKGVTFDSGGLSLKPADSMMDMKIDMAGAAAVVGVFSVLSRLNLPLEIHGIAALVENMPSSTAIRPGDIVKTMSGKTIEILNTDAEGRVILADALFYGTKQKPDMMIDLATLTGACMVALGHDVAGLMSTDKKLTERLLRASEKTGEAAWELPLVAEYAEMVKSRHADVKNITGGRYGGAITAGLFLKEFVGETPWTHLDIAGPAYNERDYPDYRAWGASGFGVRLLLEFLRSL